MITTSDALLAFHAALDRIEADKRRPTVLEDRTLRHARNHVLAHPELTIKMLEVVPDAFRRLRQESSGDVVRTIAEWRVDLRSLAN